MTTIAHGKSAPQTSLDPKRCLNSAACFWGLLALYLVAHIALRLWETPNIAKNEVQEAIAAQSWAWGYHPRNPPLHTWMLMASYAFFGSNLLAHTLLRYVLLGAVYAFAYLSGRRLLSSNALAALCALCLSLLGPFAWTVHTALTHTLLLAVMVMATFWSAVRLTQERRLIDYIVFGSAIAGGLLAKYSFLLFLGPLLAAMISVAPLRTAIFDRRFLATLATALALIAPHALWMLGARFDFGGFLAEVEDIDVVQPYFSAVAEGLGDLLGESIAFLALFALAIPFLLPRKHPARASALSPWARATFRASLIAIALLLLNVLLFRATNYEVRYLLCALLLAPMAIFMWLNERGGAPTERSTVVVLALVFFTGLGGFAALTARAALYHNDCRSCYEEMPVEALVASVRSAGFEAGTIVTSNYYVGGNLRLAFPSARVIATNYPVLHPPLGREGKCLIVWDARLDGDAPPAAIRAFMERNGVQLPEAIRPSIVEAYLHRDHQRLDRFAYWTAPNADEDCQPLPP